MDTDTLTPAAATTLWLATEHVAFLRARSEAAPDDEWSRGALLAAETMLSYITGERGDGGWGLPTVVREARSGL